MMTDVLAEILNRITSLEERLAILEERVSKKKPSGKPVGTVPHDEIFAMWNQTPNVKPAAKLTVLLRQRMTARWREHPSVDWFAALFTRVAQSRFLTGRAGVDFVATLEWTMRPQNAAKIEAGDYDDRDPVAQPYRNGLPSPIEEFLVR